ncbi:MAG: hypothetical protein KZQ59_06745 [Candidatus Thiodiazotropha sp. (ex Lucinoma aequizonata)]|nr:hypothetical protein [Candidatus Thiodiazotropha sp. (ex Lucinoma aequizonata)]MCU7908430.1 hypothetical protein [Candidatus Thiodiazotropha sp. (ex Lucinoma aequizonata)]
MAIRRKYSKEFKLDAISLVEELRLRNNRGRKQPWYELLSNLMFMHLNQAAT